MSNKSKTKDTDEQPVRRSSFVAPADDTETKVLPEFLSEHPRAGALSMKDSLKQREAAMLDPDRRISMPDLPTDEQSEQLEQPELGEEVGETTEAPKQPVAEVLADWSRASFQTTPEDGLRTRWYDTKPDFDVDQIAVHAWTQAPEGDRGAAVEHAMTLSDIEELIESARLVENEHLKRAKLARDLFEALTMRLAGSYIELGKEDEEQ